MNTFGHWFRVTTWGESHGPALGAVIDGLPAGMPLDESVIQPALDRRRPGQSRLVTPRAEADRVVIEAGVFEGRTTGAPVSLLVRNGDVDSSKYANLKDTWRPSHADYTYEAKYGFRDWRGGARASARETVTQADVDQNDVRCPDVEAAARFEEHISDVRRQKDSVGGIIGCVIRGLPAGWGEPVFGKLEGELARAMLSLPASKGFEIGSGFAGTQLRGSEHNDAFEVRDGRVRTTTNRSGGIQGGISNGETVVFRVAFKPVATIFQPQETVNRAGETVSLEMKGRHDPCVLPRAVPIVEAMALLVLADAALAQTARSGWQGALDN